MQLVHGELLRDEEVGEHAGDDTKNPPPLWVAKCPSLLHTLECRALLDLTAPFTSSCVGIQSTTAAQRAWGPDKTKEQRFKGARLPWTRPPYGVCLS